MRNFISLKKNYIFIVTLLIFVVLPSKTVWGYTDLNTVLSDDYYYYVNEDSGYEVLVDDRANLLSESEENALTDIMYYDGASYGNMVFLTCSDAHSMTASDYQWYTYNSVYGDGSSGVVFLIDMDNRKIWMQGYGDLSDKIDVDTANSIADKIYTYASDGEYGECAIKGFNLIIQALGGKKITGTLKYLGNACIALIFSIIATFIFAFSVSAKRKATDREILDNIERYINISNHQRNLGHVERIYDPPSSSSSDSSSGGGGGGGGGHSF